MIVLTYCGLSTAASAPKSASATWVFRYLFIGGSSEWWLYMPVSTHIDPTLLTIPSYYNHLILYVKSV
jgi:hypothetical protein